MIYHLKPLVLHSEQLLTSESLYIKTNLKRSFDNSKIIVSTSRSDRLIPTDVANIGAP